MYGRIVWGYKRGIWRAGKGRRGKIIGGGLRRDCRKGKRKEKRAEGRMAEGNEDKTRNVMQEERLVELEGENDRKRNRQEENMRERKREGGGVEIRGEHSNASSSLSIASLY